MQGKRKLLNIPLLVLMGCHPSVPSVSRPESFVIPGSVAQRMTLGQAYDSHRARHGSVTCVEGETIGNLLDARSTVEYSRDMSYEQLMKSIAGELSAGVNFPSLSVTGKAEYASEHSSSAYQEAHNLIFRYSAREKFKLGSVVAKASPEILPLCKNEFVNELEVGGVFTASLSMEFKNSKDKERFAGSLKIDVLGGTVKVEGALQQADEATKESIQIHLSAMQEGGDPRLLATVFSPELASCQANNLEPCIISFQKLIAYGRSLETQMQDRTHLVVLAYHTESYQATGLDELIPSGPNEIDPDVEQTRAAIEAQLQTARDHENRLDYLLSRSTASDLQTAHERVKGNQDILSNALKYCYQYPYAVGESVPCLTRYEQDRLELQTIDAHLLEGDS